MGASVHYATGTKLHAWRHAIGRAARDEWGEGAPTFKAVTIELHFRMERPKNQYADLQYRVKARYEDAEPSMPPDLDKLIRAVLDALTGIVYDDDSQVVSLTASKTFARFAGLDIVVSDA